MALIEPLESSVPEALFGQILEATDQGRALDAYRLALQVGPLEKWSDPDKMLLAARLARHLGGNLLSWRLVNAAYKQRRHLARFLTQRIYGVTERRGLFSAWQMAQRFEHCESESPLEKAEALVCRGNLNVLFRDFETALSDFAEAQHLAPQSPWVWTEYSGLWAAQGDHARANEYVDYALSLQPFFRPAIQQKVQYLQTQRRDEEALQLLETARLHLQFYGITLQLISIYSEQENWKLVLPLLEEARAETPLGEKDLEVFFAMKEADARIGLGDLKGAAVHAEKASKVKFYKNLAQRLRENSTTDRRVKIEVPYIHQEYNTCAPATLSAITAFWDRPIPQETLVDAICYDGTTDFAERRWAEQNGWHTREFKVTWDSATSLLDLGIPFILTTTEIESGHAQAVMGYDTLRHSLLIRDPNTRHHAEVGYDEFAKHYESVGPRGLVVLPSEKVALIAGLQLPETELYDCHFKLNCALDEYDRPRAESALQELEKQAPHHRLYWMGRRALANYDQNPVLHLEAVDHLRQLFPEDDRLIQARISLLRMLGRNEEITNLLRDRFAKPKVPSSLWLQYDQELTRDATRSNFALRLARRSLKHNPHNLGGLATLATNLWNAYYREAAVSVQRLAASLGDKRENIAHTYFQMLLGLGRTQEGLDYLHRRAWGLLDRSSDATLTFAQALDQLNRTQEARETLHAALGRRPHDGDLLLFSAQFEAYAGQVEQSFQLLHSASAHSNRVVWLRSAARLYRRVGDYEQSLIHWQEVAAISPLDLEAHREIALLVARRDGKGAGEEYVVTIGQRYPQHVGILQLEIAWLKEERADVVERRLIDFVQANPYNSWAQRELALAQHKRQEFEDALQRAQFARQIDPYNPDSWQVEAVVLESLEREAEAIDYFRYSLALRIDGDFALRRLLILSDTVEKKREVFQFVREQIEHQKVVGPAINSYREMAFALLSMEELTDSLRDIWQKRPDRWEAWNSLSLQLLASNKFVEAEEIAVAATERFPLLPVAWRHAGIVQGQRGRWNEAIHSFQLALQLEPEWTAAVHSLANAYRRTDQLPKAMELFEQAHRRNSLEATFLGAWADLLWHSGKREEAVQHLQKAVDLNPDYDWGWTTLSQWSRVLTRKDLALEMCRERAQRLQRDAAAWLWVAQLASQPDQAAEQLDAANRARESDPRHVSAHDWVAVALMRQRRYDEALEACHPPVFGNRVPIPLRGRAAWILFQKGQHQEALAAMKAVLRIDPQYYWGWEMVTDWNLQKNDRVGALEGCEQLIRLAPASPHGYVLRAQIHVKNNKRDLAKKDYQRAAALAPTALAAGWQLFRLQLEDREFAMAEKTLELMQLHASPEVMLPARMIFAAHRNKIDEALNYFAQAALLPDIDTGALHEAVTTIDKLNQGAALNSKLGSVMKDPALNPVFAAMWVSRRGKSFSWNLLKQFRLLSPQPRIHAAFLERWLLEGRDHAQGLKVVQLIQNNCRDEALKNTVVWGTVGNVLTSLRRYREAVTWLQDWPSRSDVQGWMLTNLVFSLHSLDRHTEADDVSREILKRELRDHTTSIHLAYLTLTALEDHRTKEARALFNDIHFEGQSLEMKNVVKQAIKSALAVQEAATAEEKLVVFEEQRKELYGTAKSVRLVPEFESMKMRALKVMKSDAGKRAPHIDLGNPPSLASSWKPRFRSFRSAPRRFRIPAAVVLTGIWLFFLLIGPIIRFFSFSSPPQVSLDSPDLTSVSSPKPIVLSPPAALPPSPGPAVKDLIAQAKSQERVGGNINDIIACFEQALKIDPDNVEALCLYAGMQSALKHYDRSIELAQHAVQVAPRDQGALRALDYAFLKAGRLAEAETLANQIIESDPESKTANLVLGVVALTKQDWPTAVVRLTQSIRADPTAREPWFALVNCYVQSKQASTGVTVIEKLAQSYPTVETAWFALGRIKDVAGDYPGALEAYAKARDLAPSDYELWNCLGLAFSHANQLDKAQDAYHKSLELFTTYDEAWNNLGDTFLRQGDLDKAADTFRHTLEINPHFTKALVNLTRTYIKQGHLDLAQKTCDNLAAIDSTLAAQIQPEIHP